MSATAMTLKSFRTDDRKLIAVYEGRHSTGGARGTTLSFDVVLTREGDQGPWEATIRFDNCVGADPRAALDRLGEWCGRAAEALVRNDDWWTKAKLPVGDPVR